MNNAILNIMMNRLKQTNPNAYSNINSLMQSGGDANGLLNQVLSNATPEQKQNLFQQAKQFGCPDNILSQLQNKK